MEPTALIHGNILTPSITIENGDLLVADGKILALGPAGTIPVPPGIERIDSGKGTIAPGLIDAHTHGGSGYDYMTSSPEDVEQVLAWLPSTGVTGVLPTLASASLEEHLEMVARLRRVKERRPGGAAFLGIHLEGPYLNPAKRGGQPLEPIRLPSIPEMDQLIEASGHNIRLVTLAPELPGALDLIRFLTSQGIVSSAGHSEATYVQMVMAVEAGLTRATHLYNGMPSLGHRNPGIVGAVLTLDAIYAELILDGVHIDPVAAEVALRAKGLDRIVLVTDATQAVGMDAGVYVRPGNRKVIVRDGAAWLESGSLAGSVLTMNRAVANATRFLHLPLADALALASRVAAQSLGAGATKGVLAPGMDADLVLLGEDMDIRMTMIAGKVVYRSSSSKMDTVKWSI